MGLDAESPMAAASVNTLPPLSIVTEFLLINGFTPGLSSSISAESIQLNDKINNWLKPIIETYYGQTMVNSAFANFRPGSVIPEVDLEFKANSTTPSNPDIVRTLYTALTGSGNLGDLVLDKTSITSNTADVNTLPPLRIVTEFLLIDGFTPGLSSSISAESIQLNDKINNWIKKLFGNEKGFSEVYVMKLTKGSVVASTEVTFSPGSISPSRVSQILLNGIPSLETEGLKIDPTSINPPVKLLKIARKETVRKTISRQSTRSRAGAGQCTEKGQARRAAPLVPDTDTESGQTTQAAVPDEDGQPAEGDGVTAVGEAGIQAARNSMEEPVIPAVLSSASKLSTMVSEPDNSRGRGYKRGE
ncbi:UNVERIFIED_CONTAM: hypothetical protein FKN15_009197 [Acipenser sinensis]